MMKEKTYVAAKWEKEEDLCLKVREVNKFFILVYLMIWRDESSIQNDGKKKCD